MKGFKKLIFSLLALVIIFSFVACNGSKSSEVTNITGVETKDAKETSTTEEKYTIGWSVYNSAYEFFMSMQEGVLAKAEELGIDVITHDQKLSTLEMITGVTNLIESGIDALVISPYNPEAMVIVADLAKKAGIPVIVVDIGTGVLM